MNFRRLQVSLRIVVPVIAIATWACSSAPPVEVQEYTYEVVHAYPHDPGAFTEGIFYLDGYLYEGTGMEKESSIRKVRLETGEVVQKHDLPEQYFGEGIINWKDRLIELTYKSQVGFIYDLAGLTVRKQFEYPGEGWALTQDGKRLIMSDGTPELRFWDPETLQETGRLTVTEYGQPLKNVNELEWVNGEIYANVWLTNRVVRIDPGTGKVVGSIDLSGLLNPNDAAQGQPDVLNGIAYDAKGDRLFVTGKRWPKLFEIRLRKK
jgi:glutaminyl-peptide cyclotransferase